MTKVSENYPLGTTNIADDRVLAPVIGFLPPYRVGKKQMRAVLDSKGKEIVIFPIGLEHMALEYSQHLNRIHPNGC
jgi:hypothetical protein